jgi:hypothetical protein
MLLRREADAQVDVRLLVLGLPARPDGAHAVALVDDLTADHTDRAEVEQGDRVAVGRLDRDRAAAPRHGSYEVHTACGRRTHGGAERPGDVDTAMLTRLVRVVADGKRLQHRPVHGPGPGERGLHADLEREEDRKQDDDALHRLLLLVVYYGNRTSVAEPSAVVKGGYNDSR